MLIQKLRHIGLNNKMSNYASYLLIIWLSVFLQKVWAFETTKDCQVHLHPEILNNTLDTPDLIEGLDWSNPTETLSIIDGPCTVIWRGYGDTSFQLYEGVEPEASNVYFFYISEAYESPSKYRINFNGHRDFTHAQWFITEDAVFRLADRRGCFEDSKIQICINPVKSVEELTSENR